MINNDVKG